MPSANSKNEPLLDFAADIAKAANMFIQIKDGKFSVINKIQTSSSIFSFRNPELLSLSITPSYPIKKIYSEFEFNTPYPSSQTLAQETKHVAQNNLSFGEELEYDALSTKDAKVLEFLRAILITEASPIATAVVFGVRDDLPMGYRITCFDDLQNLKATITITKIVYEFDNENTIVSGPSTLEFVREL